MAANTASKPSKQATVLLMICARSLATNTPAWTFDYGVDPHASKDSRDAARLPKKSIAEKLHAAMVDMPSAPPIGLARNTTQ